MITFHAAPKDPLDNEEIRTFFANIDLILANADKILQDEIYSNIRIKGTGIDGIYIGHIDLFLGDLIRLWHNETWRKGQKYYYHLGGSPLSGMSFCTYWENGKIGCDKSTPSFGTLLRPANMVIRNLQEQPDGIPIPFPKRHVSELNINDLIAKLNQVQPM